MNNNSGHGGLSNEEVNQKITQKQKILKESAAGLQIKTTPTMWNNSVNNLMNSGKQQERLQ